MVFRTFYCPSLDNLFFIYITLIKAIITMFELTKNKNKRKKIDPLALVSSEFLPQSSAQESKLK